MEDAVFDCYVVSIPHNARTMAPGLTKRSLTDSPYYACGLGHLMCRKNKMADVRCHTVDTENEKYSVPVEREREGT